MVFALRSRRLCRFIGNRTHESHRNLIDHVTVYRIK